MDASLLLLEIKLGTFSNVFYDTVDDIVNVNLRHTESETVGGLG